MIRWITDRLGTAPATSAEIRDQEAVLDVRDLVDKFGNDPKVMRRKIDEGVARLRSGSQLIVCCDYGISRSNAIAAGILSIADDISLEQAVRLVMEATGEREMKLDPLGAVREALASHVGAAVAGGLPRVLLTGASGFIGKALRPSISDRVGAMVCADGAMDLTAGAVPLALLAAENSIDCVVHLANPRIYTSNRAMGDTLSMLRNVLDVCKSTSARLIYLSSWEVYSGYSADPLIADESIGLRPNGPYGETKTLCERLIQHHRDRHGLECSIVRAAPVFGVDSDRPKFIYSFARKAKAGSPILTHRYRNASPKLDLLHVDDLVRALSAIIHLAPSGDFNLGGGKLLSTAEIAEQIIGFYGSRSTVGQVPIEDDVANIVMDSSRAREQLGWSARNSFSDIMPTLLSSSER